MDLGLQGKKVFITGSSRGIGLATAEAFLAEGATVVLNGRDEVGLSKAAERLNQTHLNRVYHVAGDILSEEGMSRVSGFLTDNFPSLDVFIANLGSGKPESGNPLDLDEWRRFYDVNVLGNIGILDQSRPMLRKGSNPNVVFLSSIVARECVSAPCGYAAAKSAVLTLTKYLARSWASDGIRINCVLPGNVFFEGGRWEELLNRDKEGVTEYINSSVPMKRFGRPEEIADAILFLASERASFITGAQLCVDGGQLAAI